MIDITKPVRIKQTWEPVVGISTGGCTVYPLYASIDGKKRSWTRTGAYLGGGNETHPLDIENYDPGGLDWAKPLKTANGYGAAWIGITRTKVDYPYIVRITYWPGDSVLLCFNERGLSAKNDVQLVNFVRPVGVIAYDPRTGQTFVGGLESIPGGVVAREFYYDAEENTLTFEKSD